MGIATINWLSGIAFGVVFLVIILKRIGTRSGALESQIGWALAGGFGGAALTKAAYPIYLFVRYRSMNGVDDAWLYIYGGSVAAVFVGLAIIANAWKANG